MIGEEMVIIVEPQMVSEELGEATGNVVSDKSLSDNQHFAFSAGIAFFISALFYAITMIDGVDEIITSSGFFLTLILCGVICMFHYQKDEDEH